MTRLRRKRILGCVGLALIVSVLLVVASQLGFLSSLETSSSDFLFKPRTTAQARATVIVGVDQRSYRELQATYGPFPDWPRSVYARTVDALVEAGSRVIVFDILFDTRKPDDAELAAALGRAGNVLIPVEAQGPLSPTTETQLDFIPQFDTLVQPDSELMQSAAGEGLVNVTTDQDAVIRSLPLVLRAAGADVPSMAVASVARYVRRPRVIDSAPDRGHTYAAGRSIPTIDGNRLLINYLGPPSSVPGQGPFKIIPLLDVLSGNYDPELVRDKIVVLGVLLPNIDVYATPSTSSTRMWGTEILGNAIETLLNQRFLVPLAAPAKSACIVVMALLGGVLVALRTPVVAALGALAVVALYLLSAMIAVDNGVLLSLVYPLGALLLTFAATLTYQLTSEQTEQRMLREVMGRYLSPSVSDWVLHDPDRLHLGGETRTMTVLFADVRGFTTLSQGLDAQLLVKLMNEYMSAMTDVVFKYDGVVDKYIGDAVMAFWNAPMHQADHARLACETALAMVQKLQELQADWRRRGVPGVELGIGINTGPMVVGNMGSNRRLAYTVLGDTVNIASRLEGLSKLYGTQVVIGERTRDAAGGTFAYRFLDRVVVKGRDEPLAVYQVLSLAVQFDPHGATALARYEHGVELYRKRRWAEALSVFCELESSGPADGPTALYIARCRALLTNSPPSDWNAIFVAETK